MIKMNSNLLGFDDFRVDEEQKKKFDSLIKSLDKLRKGVLVQATVTAIDEEAVFVDLSLKSNGKILKEEFGFDIPLPEVGSQITVLLESLEDRTGHVAVSYAKALRKLCWKSLEEEHFSKRSSIFGKVVRKIQSGYIVNLTGGVSAFLPKVNCVLDPKEVLGKEFSFIITKMDHLRSNIVVAFDSKSDEVIDLSEGQIVEGKVIKIDSQAAFIEINGIVAKLHISEISWERVQNIEAKLAVGQKITVKVVAISESNKVSVSLKDLEENPWVKEVKQKGIDRNAQIQAKVKAVLPNLAIFIYNDIELLLKPAEVSWSKDYQNLDNLKNGQMLKVKVIFIDQRKSKVYVSLKALKENAFEAFISKHNVSDVVEGEVVAISEMGYIVKLAEELNGLVPNLSSYLTGSLKIGDKLKLVIHKISNDTQNIILGNK